MNKNRIASILFAVLFLLSTIGCSTKEASTAIPPSQKQEQTTDIIVTDQIGRQVQLPKEAEKIVSSYYISTSLLIALGVEEKLVGVEMKADTREIYKRAAPELLDLPAIGSGKGVNIEEIAKLEPDIVILPLKLKDSVKQLEELKIPVIVIDPETMDGFIESIDLISTVVGQAQKGQELISYYQESIQKIQEKTESLAQKPTVYLAGTDYFTTCTSKMYQNDLIKLAGGKNVSDVLTQGYWQKVSPEQLLDWNPEYFFMVSYADYEKQDILSDEKLAQIDAIQKNQVFVFPSILEPWDYPTPSSVLGILWLTSTLHPELVSKEDYLKEAKAFYQTYYGIEVEDAHLGV